MRGTNTVGPLAGRRLGLLLGAMLLVAPAGVETAAAEQGAQPDLWIHVENEGSEDWQATLTVDGPETWTREVTVSAGETLRQPFNGTDGAYEIQVEAEKGEATVRARTSANTANCMGPYLAPFQFTDRGISTTSSECQGTYVPFMGLLAEARQAREADGGESIHVPQPRDASEGQYELADSAAAPDWDNATTLPFRWQPNQTFHDAWGRTVEGTEVVLGATRQAEARASSTLGSARTSAEIEHRVRYAGEDTDPISRTSGVSASARTTPVSSSSQALWNVEFDPDPLLLDCFLRNDRQGSQVQAGASAEPFCSDDDFGPEMEWWTGPLEERRGLSTVSLYGVDDLDNPTVVAKVTWAHGIAHPIAFEAVKSDDEANEHGQLAANLTRVEPEGTPVDQLPAPPSGATTVESGPQRPLEGPKLSEDARVPFPLEEAVDAARQDPTLTELQSLLEGDAVLAGAELSPRESTDAGQARELVWVLAFTTADEGPVLAECTRPSTGDEAGSLSPPTSACEETDDASREARHLGDLPQLGPDDLVSRSATWDEALDRWALMDPDNASAALTLASYRPALVGEPEDSHEVPPLGVSLGTIRVGTDGGGGPDAGTSQENQAPTTVAVAADDGRTRLLTTGVKETGLGPSSGGLAATAVPVPDEGGLVSDTDAVVATTAGAGLLGLLAFAGFALYNRLKGEEVLAHDTRRRIRDLLDEEPGLHGQAIARRVDANERTVEHHLHVLEREDVLTVLERGGYNHYFVNGQHTPKEMQALASLHRGKAERVYELVRQDPGLDLSTLAEQADISKPYASKLVSQLVDVGLVDKVREGRRARLYANEIETTTGA